jgi:hypothetical protein
MLVPLSIGAQKGNLSAVTAGQLAAPPVIQNLQEQPGKAIPERKDLTELQQRGIDQGQQQAQAQQQQLQQDQAKLQQQQQQLQQAQQQAANAQAAANATGATQQQQQAAQQAAANVQQQQAAVAQQQQQVQQEQQAAAQTQNQLAQQQQQVQQQRAGIAADQQALIQQQAAQTPATPAAGTTAAPGKVLFLYAVTAASEKLGKLVLIDRTSGKLISQSDLNTVRGRNYVTVGKSIIVVAGTTGGTAAVRLVSVDPDTLAVQKQGTDNLAATSYLAASDTSAYAVLSTAQGAFLGRFDATLALQAQSERAVDANTYIVVSGTEVFVQDPAGNILILNMDDLKEKKRNG